jgi:TolB-like protein/tetratricopeptide (TPR) repeat protein
MTERTSFLAELKRRNVIRMAGLYLVGAWLALQVADVLLPVFEAPPWVMKVLVGLLAVGFVGALVFSWVYELTPEGLKRDAEVPPEQSIAHVTAVRMDRIIIALFVAALGFFALDRIVLAPKRAADTKSEAAPVAASPDAARAGASIVVLPFADMSQAKDQEYFSDGLAEELLNLLAKIPDLRVISRSSAFSFKGKNLDVATIAKQLDVAHVLEGSVRKSGNQVRITVQLIDARTDANLWSETYDRPMDDIFAIQDQIAAAVVEQLKVKLMGAAPKASVIKPEAYALALQARQQYRLGNRASIAHSVELYQQALALVPDYADAWSGLSYAYAFQAGRVMRPVDEAIPLAREAAQQALRIDPGQAMAHANLGWIAMLYDRDLPTAASHLDRAVALAPRVSEVLRHASQFAMVLGREEQALALSAAAIDLDPGNALTWLQRARVQRTAGRLDDAIASYRRGLELAPGLAAAHHYLTQTLLMRARDRADLEAARTDALAEPDEAYRLIALALAEWALGHRAESDAAIDELIKKHERDSPFNLGYIYAYRHEPDQAFAWLDKAITYNDTGMHEVGVLRLFEPVRSDPRWRRLMERLGRTPEQLAAIRFDAAASTTAKTGPAP